MLYKKKKSRLHKRLRRITIILILLITVIILVFESQAIPFTKKCVRKQAKTISARIIGKAVDSVVTKLNYKYKDLAVINYSDKGQVNSISANSININRIKSNTIDKIQNELDKNKVYKFSLPLGSFTDITLFSTFGPDIEISFILTGSVNCKIKSKFESGGVNQTVHHIFLVVETEIITISPEYSEKVNYKTDYEIAQTVIVGSTPSTYADIVR